MTKQRKPWLDDKGQLLTDTELKRAKDSWRAEDWDNYLKETVEKPLRELPVGGAEEVAQLSDRAPYDYNDLFEIDDRTFLSHTLEESMKKLTIRERAVLKGLFWEGLSQREIAKKLQISRSAVLFNYKQGLQKLGEHLVKKVSK